MEENEISEIDKALLKISADKSTIYIIDELDHCHPEYVMDFMEFIQHGFDNRTLLLLLTCQQ